MGFGFLDQSIRPAATKGRLRAGFTLVELIVSMGILVILMAIAGQVMSLTVDSTGQAMALTEVNQEFRVLEQTLRRDLAGIVRPGPGVDEASVLLIQANPVNAYWDQNGKDVDDNKDPGDGYPHARDPLRDVPDPDNPDQLLPTRPRADILMFFTRTEGNNFVQYTYPDSPGMSTPPMTGWKQVVYGHANLGEYVPPDPGAPPGPTFVFSADAPAFEDPAKLQPLTESPIPAQRWHLARRVVHLTHDWQKVDTGTGADVDQWADSQKLDESSPEQIVAWWAPILLGRTDIIGNVAGKFSYAHWVGEPSQADGTETGGPPLFWPAIFDGGARPFARSKLDPSPPTIYADRLGHYFLPNCASFKVEWTLDPRSDFVGGRLDGERQVFWFDQGDLGDDPNDPADDQPLRSLQEAIDFEDEHNRDPDPTRYDRLSELLETQLGGDPTSIDPTNGDPTNPLYSLKERFESDPEWHNHPYADPSSPGRPNLVVFTAKRGVPPDEAPEDVFPAALRITVDLFDSGGRLKKPIRHVMVLPVGNL